MDLSYHCFAFYLSHDLFPLPWLKVSLILYALIKRRLLKLPLIGSLEPPPPPTRSGFTGTDIQVSWSAISGASDYQIRYADNMVSIFTSNRRVLMSRILHLLMSF